MKKLFVLMLTVLLLLAAAGCSSGSDDSSQKPVSGDSDQNSSSEDSPASISEQVCFEHDGIRVTAKSIDTDSIWGVGVKLLIENNSAKDYAVSTSAVIVNNCMITDLFSCDVAAGKKANDTLYLSSSELQAAGITNIGQIEIYFYVFDSSSYETVYKADCVTIKTSLYDAMDTTVNDAGAELYNKNGIRIVGKYVDENTFWGSAVLLFIENKTSQNITVTCDDMSVNGFMVDALFSATVYAGKYTIDDITIFSSSLEENDITSIDDIEVKFEIYNADTFKTIAETGALKFSAKQSS